MNVPRTLKPQHIRVANEQAMLAVIRESGKISRARLAKLLRTSIPTVSLIAQELVNCGLLIEDGYTDTGLGRPSAALRINERAALTVAVQILGPQVLAVLADLGGEILESFETTIRTSEDFDLILQRVVGAIHAVAMVGSAKWDDVAVVGVACPGGLHPVDQRLFKVGIIPALEGQPFVPRLQEELGTRVVAENLAHAAALGERSHGAARDLSHFAYAYVGRGISLGLVLNGELYRGRGGAAGEVGYAKMAPRSAASSPGGRASFEDMASFPALADRVQELLAQGMESTLPGFPELSLKEIYQEALKGDLLALKLVSEQASYIAEALNVICATLDLEQVIIGSDLGVPVNVLVDEINLHHSEDLPGPVIPTELSGRASLLGAIDLAVREAMRILPERLRARKREASAIP